MAAEEVVERLIGQLEGREPGKDCNFSVDDLKQLCERARDVVSQESTLLDVHIEPGTQLCIVGDLHGQYDDIVSPIWGIASGENDAPVKYLFLGDYVDRGPNSIEVITLLLSMKCKDPDAFLLLRGNHETRDISKEYGFYDECKDRYGQDDGEQIWAAFNDVFDFLPLAAIVGDLIFCVHGGISQFLDNARDIAHIQRPIKTEYGSEMLTDLLWADPDPEKSGWAASPRGSGNTFGFDVAADFLERNQLQLVCRAHQVIPAGYEFPFSPEQNVVTVFSAPSYCGEFDNSAAVLLVDSDMELSIKTWKAGDEQATTPAQE